MSIPLFHAFLPAGEKGTPRCPRCHAIAIRLPKPPPELSGSSKTAMYVGDAFTCPNDSMSRNPCPAVLGALARERPPPPEDPLDAYRDTARGI